MTDTGFHLQLSSAKHLSQGLRRGSPTPVLPIQPTSQGSLRKSFSKEDTVKQFDAITFSVLLLGSIMVCAGTGEAGGAVGQFITFDMPGSSCQPAFQYCTQAFAINDSGAAIGWYADSAQGMHGFLRKGDGSFVGIDPPGATCGGAHFSVCSRPTAINDEGTIVGYYVDAIGPHAYVRSPDDTYTTFNVPGAGCCIPASTAINSEGTIAGSFQDANSVTHGFARFADGTFVTFDGSTAAVNGTVPVGINPEATIAGNYYDENFTQHGFVRYHDGTIVSVDPPGSQYTGVTGINAAGVVTGWYEDPNFITHGFFRDRDGAFTSFDAIKTAVSTQPNAGINPSGAVAGGCFSPLQPCGQFVREPNGGTKLFNLPDSIATTSTGINASGLIVGWYDDVAYLQHGFIRLR